MGVISLPQSMERDRQDGIKANSVHVDENFDTLLNAVNRKLEIDGSIVPTADLPMGSHKITGLATPTASGDAATKGYVDSNACMLAGAQTISGNKDFTGTTTAVTQSVSDDSTKLATTGFVKDILETMYPVGAIYIGTQNSCPMATVMPGTTWTLVATDRALWGGNGYNGDSTIAAGLPNITGSIGDRINTVAAPSASGAFGITYNRKDALDYNEDNSWTANFDFNAARCSSIYGNSNTVQPPAYRVNVWRRTA